MGTPGPASTPYIPLGFMIPHFSLAISSIVFPVHYIQIMNIHVTVHDEYHIYIYIYLFYT